MIARLIVAAELGDTRPRERAAPAAVDALIAQIGVFRLAQVTLAAWIIDNPSLDPSLERIVAQRARVADRLLRRHWPQVLGLAEGLLDRRVLTYGEALEIWER